MAVAKHVHALVHAVFAQHLRAEQPPRAFLDDELDHHRRRAGIIMRVAVVARQAGEKTEARLRRLRAVEAGEAGRHVQHAHDGRAERAGISQLRARRVRAGDAALPVGRAGQRDARPRAGERVHGFRRVAHGVNVGIGGFHAAVGFHAAGHADFQAGGLGQFHFRLHADAQENQIRRAACCRRRIPRRRCVNRVALASGLEIKIGAANLVLQMRGHVAVQQRQNVRIALDDRDVDAAMMKRLGHFQPDEPAADDHGALRFVFVHEAGDAIHVRDVAQREDVRQLDAGNRRHDRLCALAQDEFVVSHVALRAVRRLARGWFWRRG